MRFFRLVRIIVTLKQYNLYEILKEYNRTSVFTTIIEKILFFIPKIHKDKSLPERTKLAFEELGPVFIKFAQLLSTRPDVIPAEYIAELSKLQSQVKPFSGIVAKQIVTKSLKQEIGNIFSSFDIEATASASVAQVHKAVLLENNLQVAVKILRPNIEVNIRNDIKLLDLVAIFIEKFFKDGKRLKPREIINEFRKTIYCELDLMQEAANAIELSRLHKNDKNIIIPKMYYDYCSSSVIVMEWMDGIPIANLHELRKANINLEKLSQNGVSIFYTQVFNYGFFHADMHPGNILCDLEGRYIALDFGAVGCLSEVDKRYLAINILAFFNRDYKKVATTHIESGWAPEDTSVEELENSIRAVCEPILNKPLSQISFGQILTKLFQISRRFNITVQPQLILLQKTIINIEGLGRILNPDLNLWITSKPILEKWMKEQMGWRGFIRNVKSELPSLTYTLPQIPQKLIKSVINTEQNIKKINLDCIELIKSYRRQNQLLIITIIILAIILWKVIH